MVKTHHNVTATRLLGGLLALPLLALGCADIEDADVEGSEAAVSGDAFANANGAARVVTVNGATIDENNAFFKSLGTNGRACVTCHQPSAAMTITPPQVQAVFNATQGLDPLFRLNDGANGPNAQVATVDQRRAAYSLVLSKGLIRIGLPLPANRDFDVKVVLNPYVSMGATPPQNTTIAPTATPELSFYRRPLLSANTRFIA